MTGERLVLVHEDSDSLAYTVAARLAIRLLDAQAERGRAAIVLTGGRIAAKMYAALLDIPTRDSIDWSRVDVWWGDERFVPSGDPERNDGQARDALLDALPLDPARIHPMPASDGPDGDDPDAAAARYAAELTAAADAGELPHFDVLMLGVGEDGHVASVFPEHPVVHASGSVAAVRESPKPPPVRTTLTLSAINTAEEVWLIASGAGKADAVGTALTGAGGVSLPAGSVHGVRRTLWLLDRPAAAKLPRQVGPPHGHPQLRDLR
jgi:6-phosphogluconolactonase